MAKPDSYRVTNEIILTDETIMNKIYVVHGQKVMLDRDLAELYGVQSIRLREQVKRNIDRFPDNFMFKLTTEEVEAMVSQNAIPSKKQLGGSLPYFFYRTWGFNAGKCIKKRKGIAGEY